MPGTSVDIAADIAHARQRTRLPLAQLHRSRPGISQDRFFLVVPLGVLQWDGADPLFAHARARVSGRRERTGLRLNLAAVTAPATKAKAALAV